MERKGEKRGKKKGKGRNKITEKHLAVLLPIFSRKFYSHGHFYGNFPVKGLYLQGFFLPYYHVKLRSTLKMMLRYA